MSSESTATSIFPPPPLWYSLYTRENLMSNKDTPLSLALRTPPPTSSLNNDKTALLRPYVVFQEARYDPRQHGFDCVQTPMPEGVPQLFQTPPAIGEQDDADSRVDLRAQLRELSAQCTERLVELLSGLTNDIPEEFRKLEIPIDQPLNTPAALYVEQKLQSISHLQLNMINIINRMRKHQAVHMLISMQYKRVNAVRQRTQQLRDYIKHTEELLSKHNIAFDLEDESAEPRFTSRSISSILNSQFDSFEMELENELDPAYLRQKKLYKLLS